MNNKPLTYDSLKTVILYMNPNTRFLISSQIPSIRSVEKFVPLKLESLEIGNHSIEVNETVYSYGLYQIDSKDSPPYQVSGYTPDGRWICEMNEFVRSKKRSNNPRQAQERTILGRIKSMIFGNKSSNRSSNRNNDFPRFEVHLIKEEQENSCSHVIERIEYTGDFHKAEESLRELMFAKRRDAVVVKKFIINQECPIRMPSDLKIRAKELIINNKISTNLEFVKPIIDESYLPFERLELLVEWGNDTEEIDYEFIKNSKFLEYHHTSQLQFEQIQVLRNPRVHFSTSSHSFLRGQDFIWLIRDWIDNEKPIDTCFTFSSSLFEEYYSIKLFKYVRERFDEAIVGNKCVNIPMRNSTILKISYKLDKHPYYLIKMAVVHFGKTSD
uniref:FTH domain-containing protein n=1 Tax=Caenorhabditis tropicalis TaxID=1561998 RepID=A0A1I7T3S2_9PELO